LCSEIVEYFREAGALVRDLPLFWSATLRSAVGSRTRFH
jgi:hypothetical protein